MDHLAEVVLNDGCVRGIESALLDSTTLARLHFIDGDLVDVVEAVLGAELREDDGLKLGWRERLCQRLAAAG